MLQTYCLQSLLIVRYNAVFPSKHSSLISKGLLNFRNTIIFLFNGQEREDYMTASSLYCIQYKNPLVSFSCLPFFWFSPISNDVRFIILENFMLVRLHHWSQLYNFVAPLICIIKTIISLILNLGSLRLIQLNLVLEASVWELPLPFILQLALHREIMEMAALTLFA